MRGSYNTTCDIYAGPGSATPGLLKGTFPCRLVLEDGVFLVGLGAPTRPAYLTTAGPLPVGAFKPLVFGMDAALADQVAVPTGSAVQYWVLFAEEILWGAQPLYYRANLVYLPRPHVDAILEEGSGFVLQENTSYILLE